MCDNKYKGDRLCPECEIESLVEYGSTQWKCSKCKQIFDEEYLDYGIEEYLD